MHCDGTHTEAIDRCYDRIMRCLARLRRGCGQNKRAPSLFPYCKVQNKKQWNVFDAEKGLHPTERLSPELELALVRP